MTLTRVLIANRGEIAVRIVRTCAELGIESVAVHSAADAHALHTRLADRAVRLPGSVAAQTYLDAELLIAAAVSSGADAVHPGYGFLSESADFVRRVEDAGLVFVGPPSRAAATLGDKVAARALARAAGVPIVPGLDHPDTGTLIDFGNSRGWPVAVKAALGGGGRGMRVVHGPDEAKAALSSARAEARAAFGDAALCAESYLEHPRHVEVQVFADTHGTVRAIGDRDCSVQRRHQKLVEEAPAPDLDAELRAAMADAAVTLISAVDYAGAATVEFLVEDGAFFFLECNTRIQVEHPVTEAVFGIDLVREQLLVAGGARLGLPADEPRGHAFEVRVNAEDPARGFLPTPGRITALSVPWRAGVRVDTGYEVGEDVPPFYDSLVAKIVVWGPTRDIALHRLRQTVRDTVIEGIASTLPALEAVASHPDFAAGGVSTHWFEDRVAETVACGAQDVPGVAVPADGVVVIAGRRHRVPAAAERARARTSRTTARRPPAVSSSSTTDEGFDHELTSPMNGTVTSVLVEPGSTITRGDTVATVEAMKMEHRIVARHDAAVDDVCVHVGEPVQTGATLVRLVPRDGDTA